GGAAEERGPKAGRGEAGNGWAARASLMRADVRRSASGATRPRLGHHDAFSTPFTEATMEGTAVPAVKGPARRVFSA
ncbi:MAG TPA: hypothetical protein VF796_00450, partial [Humisphaera sp.]